MEFQDEPSWDWDDMKCRWPFCIEAISAVNWRFPWVLLEVVFMATAAAQEVCIACCGDSLYWVTSPASSDTSGDEGAVQECLRSLMDGEGLGKVLTEFGSMTEMLELEG